MKKSATIVLSLCAAILLAASCHREVPVPEPATNPYSRVMILCAMGFNSLSPYIRADIEELAASAEDGYIPPKGSNRALVVIEHLVDPKYPTMSTAYRHPTSPLVIQISRDHLGNVICDTLKTYTDATILSDKETLSQAFDFVRTKFVSDSYGIVFSSHGTGYLPKGYYDQGDDSFKLLAVPKVDDDNPWPDGIPVKTFSETIYYTGSTRNSSQIELADLPDCIPMKTDYILFDACFMGGVEVAYELRNVTKCVGFSQAEVAAEGFVYKTIAKRLLGGDAPDPEGVLRDYYEMSAAHESKIYRSATISLVDCGKLEPLATLCKELFETYRNGLAAIDYSTVQGFYRMNKHWFFDLEDILIHAGMTDADHARLTEALNGCVTYKAATERVLDDFDVNIFCGLSMYLPCAGSAKLDSYYRNLAWNSAAGLVK